MKNIVFGILSLFIVSSCASREKNLLTQMEEENQRLEKSLKSKKEKRSATRVIEIFSPQKR